MENTFTGFRLEHGHIFGGLFNLLPTVKNQINGRMHHVQMNEHKYFNESIFAKSMQCIQIISPKSFSMEPDELVLKGTNSQDIL